jgi:hypothetical protein
MSIFWGTLRLNSKDGNFLTHGMHLTISLNTECTLFCEYCPLLDGREARPKFEKCSLEEWKSFIQDFPEWISLICIAGGEPSLLPWIGEFVNWLTSRGHHVIMYSNLYKPWYLEYIKKSYRFYIQATFHHNDDPERFTKAYKRLIGDGYRVDAFELDNEEKVLPFTNPKPFLTPEDGKNFKTFHCPPDAPRTKVIYRGAEYWYKESK